jgi:hypothetical protein
MKHYAGLDVSVKETSICIVDEAGRICREMKVVSHPEDLLAVLCDPAWRLERVGLEAGPLSQWLFSGLAEAGVPADRVIYVEAGDEKSVLFAARRPWRCRSRSRATLHDGLPPPSACRRRLGHHRHRHPPLAAAGRGGRFRPADGLHHPLARQRTPRNPVACSRRWTPPMAARIDPVLRRGKRRFRSGGLRCQGSSRASFRPGPRTG